MQAKFPFYHTTDDIRAELRRLSKGCPGLDLEIVGDSTGDRAIDVVTFRLPGSEPVNKVFLLFGEHARELISPESGLHFVKTLCGETPQSESAKAVLRDSEFKIVVNGNPGSRRRVEQGEYCLRTNPNGVDLNRNWDEHWQSEPLFQAQDTNPGPSPFSETETQAFRDLVKAYAPTTFLTVHSGTKGMYMPWAFDREHLAQRNQPEMMQMLRTLDGDHCQCPFGAAGKEVGYSCPGTCLDWVYDNLPTEFAFAFEIYVRGDLTDDLRERWQEKLAAQNASVLQTSDNLAHEQFRDVFAHHPSCFVQLREEHAEARNGRKWPERDAGDCFAQFNPSDEVEFQAVIENWSSAYLQMSAMAASHVKEKAHAGQVPAR